MSNKARWSLISLTVMAAAAAALKCGIAVRGLTAPLVILAIIVAAACYFRREPKFTLCLNVLAQISIFSMAFVLLTYATAELARPLIDARLAAIDRLFGFYLPNVVAWRGRHPSLGNFLQLAYDSLLPQTAVIIATLSFSNDRKELGAFVSRLTLAALIALACFAMWPAEGPFDIFNLAPSPTQSHYLDHFFRLRAGEFRQFNFADAEGIITFPSFHAVWAILLFMAVSHRRYLREIFALLEIAVIISTMTTGWHYLTDVLAGCLLATTICWCTRIKSQGDKAASQSEPPLN